MVKPDKVASILNHLRGYREKLEKLAAFSSENDLDEAQRLEILEGRRAFGRLDQDWAARRLLEYAPYAEIIRLC